MTDQSRRVRQQELAFFAKLGADVSHEMRNVLSIVGQNAGLLEDQLTVSRGRKGPDPEKLKKVASRIDRQVKKGIEVMERFSRFAHAADEARTSFDLAALAEDVTVLIQPHLRHLGGRLEATLPDQPVPVTTNQFSLQHALFCCLEIVVQCADNSQPVVMDVSNQGATAVVTVSATAGPGNNGLSDRLSELSVVLHELEATASTRCEEGVLFLILNLPVRSAGTG
jgi:signal transduction histidine kinase